MSTREPTPAIPAGKPKPLAKGGWLRRTLKWLGITGLLGFLAGVVAIIIGYQMVDIPDPNENFQTETTFVYYADGRHTLGKFALQDRVSVSLSDVPDHVQDAVVAAENRSFWTDTGIDPKAIIRAAWSNLHSNDTQGASTITQQYVKVLYLSQDRSWQRKIKEAFLAVKIENQMSKEQILQGYLNTIYFGRGAYGIEAAAQAYFDKSVSELTVAEGATLAAILNSPGGLDPSIDKGNRRALRARYRYVLDGMVELGALPAEEGARLRRHLPKFPTTEEEDRLGGPQGHLLALVEDELRRRGFTEEEIYGGGLRITTTFDWQAQRAAQAAVRQTAPKRKAKGVHIAIASVQPGTGAVRAMYGGPDYVESQRNWALTGRQPGSAFKPFALAAGLENGVSFFDVLNGNYYEFRDGTVVRNDSGHTYGYIDLLTATTVSSNTAYVDLTVSMKNGPQKVRNAAIRAGIPRDAPALEAEATIALGSADIRPVDMANAMATFAARGRATDWYVVESITDTGGAVRYDHRPRTIRAFTAAVAADVTYALRQVVEEGTGTAAQALRCPAAAKTGTAAKEEGGVVAAWFVGYTPQLSTAVMYVRGKDGFHVLDGVGGADPFYGGNYPARTWTTYMNQALQGSPCKPFPKPAYVTGEPPPPTPTYTPTPTPTPSPTPTPTPTETTESPTPTETTESPTPTPTETTTQSPTPTETPTPTTPTPTTPAPTTPAPTTPTPTTPTSPAPTTPTSTGTASATPPAGSPTDAGGN